MDTPSEVLIHNDTLGLKGARGRLLQVHAAGFYEVNLQFGDKRHRALLPTARTVIISTEPEEVSPTLGEIER